MTIFPPAIEKYRITDSTPSRDLLTLGRFYSEAGGYASAIFDRSHQTFAKKCRDRYERVIDTLIDREVIFSPKDIWAPPKAEFNLSDLEAMTIDQLETQYLLCSKSHDSRRRAGREGFTYFQEGYIVEEMSRRCATNRSEQIRIEYCRSLYRNEIENMAFIIRKPEGTPRGTIIFDHTQDYTPDQLVALIRLYGRFRSVVEREVLVQCVDKALDLIEKATRPDELMTLASELTQPYCSSNVQIPDSIYSLILGEIKRWTRMHHLDDSYMIMPMLSYAMHTSEWSWHHKAERIINRCYRKITNPNEDFDSLDAAIDTLYIVTECNEFVSRYGSVKIAETWDRICTRLIESDCDNISATQLYKLLDVGSREKSYADISDEKVHFLLHKLNLLCEDNDTEALAYAEIINRTNAGTKASSPGNCHP